MSDPVVEAAHRALVSTGSEGVVWVAEAAAREALAPIREIHRPVLPPGIERCKDCDVPWPCATAKLAYPSDELT